MIGELGAGLPEAQTQIDRDGILIAVLGSEAERRILPSVEWASAASTSRRPWPWRRWAGATAIRSMTGVPATIRPRRKPTGDPLSRTTKHGSAPPASRWGRFPCRCRDLIGDEGSAWEAVPGKGPRAMAAQAARWRASPDQIPLREFSKRRDRRYGDQAFDPPEARNSRARALSMSVAGNATGAEREVPASPAPDEVRERLGKALAAASDLQAVDRTAEDLAVEILARPSARRFFRCFSFLEMNALPTASSRQGTIARCGNRG